MKIAVVFNRGSKKVINLFGKPNQEAIGLPVISRIVDALRAGGHHVAAFEGDKDLVQCLESFMPRVIAGERPGLVFNLSYGIQGEARYTHIPGLLEMLGVPYVGSGPLAHSLALDKVVTKMILRQHGLPTPDFYVLDNPETAVPEGISFPLIVKPRNEAVSIGLRVVNDEAELRAAAAVVLESFPGGVLAEAYVEGREINVSLLGNSPPVPLPPVMLDFGSSGPNIFTIEDKKKTSGREVRRVCPAPLGGALMREAGDLATKAYTALGCADCARVDMRLDDNDSIYILEINSLPSLGRDSSLVTAAEAAGLDFNALVGRLVEAASTRYFGTPAPPVAVSKTASPGDRIFAYLTSRRDELESRLRHWTKISSRTADPAGLRYALKELAGLAQDVKLRPVANLTDPPFVHTWESLAGMDGGVLLVAHVDVPLPLDATHAPFKRDPEWIYGEGVAVSRSPLVALEFALRSLRSIRKLREVPIGVLVYADEGFACQYSADLIREAGGRAKNVFVLRPGNLEDRVVHQRRGRRRFRFVAETEPSRPGQASRRPDLFRRVAGELDKAARLGSRAESVSFSVTELTTVSFPMLLPHRIEADLVITYLDRKKADILEHEARTFLCKIGRSCRMDLLDDRPPMIQRRAGQRLARSLLGTAETWGIPLETQSSLLPSVAGLVPGTTGVVCGLGPVGRDIYTTREAVQRISLMQRTLLLAQFLTQNL